MPLVDVLALDPTIKVDLYYATDKNFIGKPLYPKSARALLRKPVAEALVKAQKVFLQKGFSIKVWDAYRPFSIQEIFYHLQTQRSNTLPKSHASHFGIMAFWLQAAAIFIIQETHLFHRS